MPVIAYHAIGAPKEFAKLPRFDPGGLNIPVDAFRAQLAAMYAAGYRPITMRDAVQHRFPVAGKPIVLTFDDGRATQFRLRPDGTVDPNCAVGVLLAFHRQHADWPLRATFYLIAGSDDNGVPFDQEGLEGRKVRMLLKWGFEIGNHTLTHPNFTSLTGRQIVHEMAGGDRYLKHLVPGIQVDTFALPYGALPKDSKFWPLLRRGSEGSDTYKNIAVLLYDNRLSPNPLSATFDPFQVHRLIPKPGALERFFKSKSAPN